MNSDVLKQVPELDIQLCVLLFNFSKIVKYSTFKKVYKTHM